MPERRTPRSIEAIRNAYTAEFDTLRTTIGIAAANATQIAFAQGLGFMDHFEVAIGLKSNKHDPITRITEVMGYVNGIPVTDKVNDFIHNIVGPGNYPISQIVGYGHLLETVQNILTEGLEYHDSRFDDYRALLPRYIALGFLHHPDLIKPYVPFGQRFMPQIGRRVLTTISHSGKSVGLGPLSYPAFMIRPHYRGIVAMNSIQEMGKDIDRLSNLKIIEDDGVVTEVLAEYAALLDNPRIKVIKADPAKTRSMDRATTIVAALLGGLSTSQIVAILTNAAKSLDIGGRLYYTDLYAQRPDLPNIARVAMKERLGMIDQNKEETTEKFDLLGQKLDPRELQSTSQVIVA